MATTASTTAVTAAATISQSSAFKLVIVLGAAIVVAGLIIALSRSLLRQKESDSSLVRSWIAVSLVIGLLFFVAVAFSIDNQDVRSLLIGALAANAGAAIAFYFSSKTSDQARRDILDATFGVEAVPALVGVCVSDARALLGTTSFRLALDGTPADDWLVKTQQPLAHTTARRGSTITVTTAAPQPANQVTPAPEVPGPRDAAEQQGAPDEQDREHAEP